MLEMTRFSSLWHDGRCNRTGEACPFSTARDFTGVLGGRRYRVPGCHRCPVSVGDTVEMLEKDPWVHLPEWLQEAFLEAEVAMNMAVGEGGDAALVVLVDTLKSHQAGWVADLVALRKAGQFADTILPEKVKKEWAGFVNRAAEDIWYYRRAKSLLVEIAAAAETVEDGEEREVATA